MKTYNNHPDSLMLLVLKLSVFYILCLLLTNALTVRAQQVRSATSLKSLSATPQNVRQIYTSQIGVREKQPNSGLAVEKYLRYVNLPKGNPWCAAFVCWVYGQAGVENPRTGWSPELFGERQVVWERGKLEQRIRSKEQRLSQGRPYANPSSLTTGNRQLATHPSSLVTDNRQLATTGPTTGDVFGLFFVEKKRIAHVGFIDHWDGTWMISVEGNTSVSGSREGDGVYRKRRLVRSVYNVARYIQ